MFPKCSFLVLLDQNALVAGTRNSGVLQLELPEAIRRAEAIDLVYETVAVCGFGGGKNRRVATRDVYRMPLHVALPKGGLDAGTYRYPFHIDVPLNIPPEYEGNDCSIRHRINTNLDVDWAIDPSTTVVPPVVTAALSVQGAPIFVRTDRAFHSDIVVELSLTTAAVKRGEFFEGAVAVRGAPGAKYDAVVLDFSSIAQVRFGGGATRSQSHAVIRIPAEALRSGAAIPFRIPTDASTPITARNGFFDLDVRLRVSLDLPWSFDPEIVVPLAVVDRQSTIVGERGGVVLGTERLRQLTHFVAERTGLSPGAAPVFVQGAVGPVRFSLADRIEGGAPRVALQFTYPDIGLGLLARPIGMLDGFKEKNLPGALADRYLLEQRSKRFGPQEAAPFVAAATGQLPGFEHFEFSDHHLGFDVALHGDEGVALTTLAEFAKGRAKALATTIASLPSPTEFPAAARWRESATTLLATHDGGGFIPSAPALIGLGRRVRTNTGEERAFWFSVTTEWHDERPDTVITVDADAPFGRGLQEGLAAAKSNGRSALSEPLFRALRLLEGTVTGTAEEASVQNASAYQLRIHRAGVLADPAASVPVFDALIAFALATREERTVDAPYR
jgi:hypothetical protein